MYIFIILIEYLFPTFSLNIVHARQNAICYHALWRCIRRPSDTSRVETVKNYSHNSEAGNKGNHNFLYNLSPSHTTPFHLAIHLLHGAQQGDVKRSRISERSEISIRDMVTDIETASSFKQMTMWIYRTMYTRLRLINNSLSIHDSYPWRPSTA